MQIVFFRCGGRHAPVAAPTEFFIRTVFHDRVSVSKVTDLGRGGTGRLTGNGNGLGGRIGRVDREGRRNRDRAVYHTGNGSRAVSIFCKCRIDWIGGIGNSRVNIGTCFNGRRKGNCALIGRYGISRSGKFKVIDKVQFFCIIHVAHRKDGGRFSGRRKHHLADQADPCILASQMNGKIVVFTVFIRQTRHGQFLWFVLGRVCARRIVDVEYFVSGRAFCL